jgi:putative tricarboxylic transport membrane protein
MAILFGAFMIHGITPGPMIISEHPDVFWGLIASMYTGNIMLLVLNLPYRYMGPTAPDSYRILFPLIILFCLIGAYSVAYSFVDILIMILFGIIGFIMKKTGYEAAPLILAMVLGGMFENAIRQALMMSDGSFGIFLVRPISCGFILAAAILLIIPLVFRRRPLAVGIEQGG